MKTLTQILAEVTENIQDSDEYLKGNEKENAVTRALRTLSKKNPRLVFELLNDDKVNDQNEWELADTWIPGFSKITAVYYPWDTTNSPTPPPPLDRLEYSVYEGPDGAYWFRLNTITPGYEETLRVYYNSVHSLIDSESGDEQTTTLKSVVDEDAVIALASGFCLDIMAVRAIAVGDSTIGADTVSYQSRSEQYKGMANVFKKQSGLAAYLEEETPKGGAAFISIGRRKQTSDNLT